MTTLTINFTTRDSYIAWRHQWRAEYAAISSTIREGKRNLKNAHRSDATPGIYWRIYADLFKAQREAKELLALREQSKLEAGRQYTTQKEASCN